MTLLKVPAPEAGEIVQLTPACVVSFVTLVVRWAIPPAGTGLGSVVPTLTVIGGGAGGTDPPDPPPPQPLTRVATARPPRQSAKIGLCFIIDPQIVFAPAGVPFAGPHARMAPEVLKSGPRTKSDTVVRSR